MMKIKSPAFEENQLIPTIYTCDGDNTNPPLDIIDVPGNAQSLVLIVDDPDAATDPKGPGKTFDHWLLWNIDPRTSKIDSGQVPESAEEGLNGGSRKGYTGPCPPTGVHHYIFRLYALSSKLNVSPSITRQGLEKEIEGLTIAKAELIGTYSRE